MGELVARVFLSVVAAVVLTPVMLLFATPYVLLDPIFRDVPERRYWVAVSDGYWRLAKGTIYWGARMIDV